MSVKKVNVGLREKYANSPISFWLEKKWVGWLHQKNPNTSTLLLLHNNPVNQGHYSVVDNTISEAQRRELKKAAVGET